MRKGQNTLTEHGRPAGKDMRYGRPQEEVTKSTPEATIMPMERDLAYTYIE